MNEIKRSSDFQVDALSDKTWFPCSEMNKFRSMIGSIRSFQHQIGKYPEGLTRQRGQVLLPKRGAVRHGLLT